MFWVVVIILIVVVWAATSSSSNKKKAASVVHALARMLANENKFREYWRFMHVELTGSALPQQQEDAVVATYLAEHMDLCSQALTITPENMGIMLPAFGIQGDNFDLKVARSISPAFGEAMSNKRNRERAQKKFFKEVLGVQI